jgi:hypothetical protein
MVSAILAEVRCSQSITARRILQFCLKKNADFDISCSFLFLNHPIQNHKYEGVAMAENSVERKLRAILCAPLIK